MKHIKIVLVPDQPYPGPAGCKVCHYDTPRNGCGNPHSRWLVSSACLSKRNGGMFEGGGYFTIKASVSRNKREGKYRQRVWTTGDGYVIGNLPFARGHHD